MSLEAEKVERQRVCSASSPCNRARGTAHFRDRGDPNRRPPFGGGLGRVGREAPFRAGGTGPGRGDGYPSLVSRTI